MDVKQRVKTLQDAGMRGYDKHIDSKCNKPWYYGICRTADAEALLKEAASTATATTPLKAKKADNRKRPVRIAGRLYKSENAVLQRALKLSAHKTIQNFVAAAVMNYANEIISKNKTAFDAQTSKAEG